MKRQPLPYENTKIPVSKSIIELSSILSKRGVIAFAHETRGSVVTIRFTWRLPDDREATVRLTIDPTRAKVPKGSPMTQAQAVQREGMRLARVLVFYVKGLLDAVAGGIKTMEQAFFADVEDGHGRTVYEIAGPKIMGALPPGRDE